MNDNMATHNKLSSAAAPSAIVASAAALILLVSLHFLSPEFDPSWRMISEYALGHYAWVLSLMFFTWAVGTWALAAALWPHVTTKAGKVGLWLLLIAGLGEALAAVFDINQEGMHNLASLLGTGALPIAAVLISTNLATLKTWISARKSLLWTAHLTWISVVLLIATLFVMMMQFSQANGGQLPQQAPVILPPGVWGLDGWANRFSVLIFCLWVIIVARHAMKIGNQEQEDKCKE